MASVLEAVLAGGMVDAGLERAEGRRGSVGRASLEEVGVEAEGGRARVDMARMEVGGESRCVD